MKQYNFILTHSINGVPVCLQLSGNYTDAIDFDAPTVTHQGRDVTDLMELVSNNSIGWREFLEEAIAGHIEYLMANPDEQDVTTDNSNLHPVFENIFSDVLGTMSKIFNPNPAA